MQCTKCGSDNTQRLEVVHEGGTQSISTTSHSAGVGIGGGFGIGIGGIRTSTSGKSQSALAIKATPPKKKKIFWFIFAVIAGFMLLGAEDTGNNIFGLVLISAGGFAAYTAIKFNSKQWPDLFQYWKESWLCQKCGTIYHQP